MPPRKVKSKKFVLDTNVILHDSTCIYKFGTNHIIIPITVLEELDQFKKGDSVLNYNARNFLRELDSISGPKLFNGGAKIGKGCGKISVRLESDFCDELLKNFSRDKPDHHILNIAFSLMNEEPQSQVILVTKDVNLRMKAKAVGLLSEDYTSDHVRDPKKLYSGHRVFEGVSEELVDSVYKFDYEITPESLDYEKTNLLLPNEYAIVKSIEGKSALCMRCGDKNYLKRVFKNSASKIVPRNAEQAFALDALTDRNIPLVTVTGKAGTGKTLLAIAAALEKKRYYRQIFISRPAIPLSNRDIGYLPGDINSKLNPYMQPIYDNIGVIMNNGFSENKNQKSFHDLVEEEKIVVSPLSYIRGRSLVKIFFIVDEAQNLTPGEVKTIVTRAGQGAKIVFTGDVFQIDHPYLNTSSNGLSYLIDKMAGNQMYAHINLEKGERSELAEAAADIL
ncbi:MAG: PhoH family protein [Desulfobacteraceae bacterium]|nr:PhoH family protein [Desulfobacteraceae bacterium]